MKEKISIVTSLYKSEKYVEELYFELINVFKEIDCNYQIIFVDDGYPDKAKEISCKLAEKDTNIKVIAFSRNFGQHPAITAGLKHSNGDYIVVMDSDLQDKPSEIVKLFKEIKKGFDVVWAKRNVRKDSIFKRLSSKLFYKSLSFLTDTKWDNTIANFGIFSRKAIDAFLMLEEQNRSFPMIMMWLGFTSTSVSVDHQERKYDSSSYSLKKLLELALNIITYHSNKPLKLFVKIGFIISLIGFAFVLKIVYSYLSYGQSVQGWSSLIASIWLLSGIIISIMGFCGLYIGNIFNETKKRPIYIIDFIKN